MSKDELISVWNKPRSRVAEDAFDIRRKLGGCYVAVSPSDTAAIIVPLPDSGVPRGRVLGSVRLSFETELGFEVEGLRWTQPAAVIECLEASLMRTFQVVALDVLEQLQDGPITAKQVLLALGRWDELLRRRSKLTETSELGLWGELAAILLAEDRDAMVTAWRGPHGDVVDFYGGGVALECKTSPNRLQHRLSHQQATFEGESVEGYLVSVWACDDPNGRSLTEIVDELMAGVVDEGALLSKLLEVGYREEHRHEYQRKLHCPATPRFFRLERVPRIHNVDAGITNVRYDVDFSGLPSLGPKEVEAVLQRLTKGAVVV